MHILENKLFQIIVTMSLIRVLYYFLVLFPSIPVIKAAIIISLLINHFTSLRVYCRNINQQLVFTISRHRAIILSRKENRLVMSYPESSGEPMPSATPGSLKILAVVDKTLDGHGYIVRALQSNQVIYIRVPPGIFANGWEMATTPEPDLSMIPAAGGRKVWRLEATARDATGLAKEIEARTDGVPENLSKGVPELQNIHTLYDDVPCIEHTDFTIVETFKSCCGRQTNRLQVAEHPKLGGTVVTKIVEIPDRLPANETDETQISTWEAEMSNEITYHLELSGLGFVPQFLGLVTERGRGIIGYFMEHLKGAKTYEELMSEGVALSENDIVACLEVVKKMHSHGLYHGDLHLGNVMKCADGSVKIIDFQFTRRLTSQGIVKGKPALSSKEELHEIELELREIERQVGQYYEV
jgi:serine/threonine protein kinase